MNDAINAARLETETALRQQEENEIVPLVEECSALRIQCAWGEWRIDRVFCLPIGGRTDALHRFSFFSLPPPGRHQRRRISRELREKELFFLKTRAKLENELANFKRDNAAFKIQAMRHLRNKRELSKESTKAQEEVKRALVGFLWEGREK